jgi:hypothetical protein
LNDHPPPLDPLPLGEGKCSNRRESKRIIKKIFLQDVVRSPANIPAFCGAIVFSLNYQQVMPGFPILIA